MTTTVERYAADTVAWAKAQADALRRRGMIDPDDLRAVLDVAPGKRPTGYYWIIGDDEEPEPARWDAEAGLWFLIGLTQGLDPNAMTALGPVQGPSSW
ncbi:MAG: hypothetical protein ACJ8H8_13965 [Geminicoccaceae bacterium]